MDYTLNRSGCYGNVYFTDCNGNNQQQSGYGYYNTNICACSINYVTGCVSVEGPYYGMCYMGYY
jgi:hypothetical protein